MYDLIIIGGGPAGSAAGVYAARKKLKTLLITDKFGGQSDVSEEIQNWIGTVSISGAELAKNLKKHVEAYADDVLEIKEGEKVASVEKTDSGFKITTENKDEYDTKTVLTTAGSHRRKLPVPGAEEFDNKGLTYCASCDGPLFADKDVVVVGGGNAGFETAAQLLAYTKSVTLLHRSKNFRATPITVEKVLSNPKMKALTEVTITEVKGDKMVNAIVYKDKEGNEIELPTTGIFVEIGQIPTTGFIKNVLDVNEYGQIIIDPWTQKTSTPGIWAAGDSTNIKYHQNNIAVGDAVKAVEDIYVTLHTK
jgi:thioredoxin reductase